MNSWDIDRDGFCLLPQAIDLELAHQLQELCVQSFSADREGLIARSSRGHVYAARNLIDMIPAVSTIWQAGGVREFLQNVLGPELGLVRALFFDKPPERTWALAWHKDTAIAVRNNTRPSPSFSRPTIKAGVPHVIASDMILRQMMTLRIHLDEVTDENGPLRLVPGSHISSAASGWGVEQAVSIHAGMGDVLAMRPLITHGSGASHPGTTRHRRILHLEFAANQFLPDQYEWHRFVPAI